MTEKRIFRVPARFGPYPGEPSALRLPRFANPGFLGDAQAGEAATRVLAASVRDGEWVGASFEELWAAVVHEEQLLQVQAYSEESYAENIAAYATSVKWWWVLTLCSLSVWAWFFRYPVRPQRSTFDIPESGGGATRTEYLPQGLAKLKERKLVFSMEGGNTAEDLLIIPTPELVQLALEHQERQAPAE